jgi:FkbM family methyltransferase
MAPPVGPEEMTDMGVLLDHMGASCSGLIHVGANDGAELGFYLASGIKQALFIEPLDEPFRRLRDHLNAHGLPGYQAIQALCSSVDGLEYDFFVSSNAGQSSSFLQPGRHLKEHPDVTFPDSVRLRAKTLDTVVSELEAAGTGFSLQDFDALVLDVQGAEMHVFKGASRVLQQVRIVRAEVNFGGLYKGDSPLEDLQSFLRCYDFRMCDLQMNNFGWGDASFLRL